MYMIMRLFRGCEEVCGEPVDKLLISQVSLWDRLVIVSEYLLIIHCASQSTWIEHKTP